MQKNVGSKNKSFKGPGIPERFSRKQKSRVHGPGWRQWINQDKHIFTVHPSTTQRNIQTKNNPKHFMWQCLVFEWNWDFYTRNCYQWLFVRLLNARKRLSASFWYSVTAIISLNRLWCGATMTRFKTRIWVSGYWAVMITTQLLGDGDRVHSSNEGLKNCQNCNTYPRWSSPICLDKSPRSEHDER